MHACLFANDILQKKNDFSVAVECVSVCSIVVAVVVGEGPMLFWEEKSMFNAAV